MADPPAAAALAVSTAEDTALAFAAAHFEGVFTDPDGDTLKQVQVVSLPDAGHGELALDGSAVAANQVIDHADLGDLTFTPVANWHGAATFDFKVVDQTDAQSAKATATVTVRAVNDTPAAGALAMSTAEDTALTFAASDFTGVFTDVDAGDSLKAVAVGEPAGRRTRRAGAGRERGGGEPGDRAGRPGGTWCSRRRRTGTGMRRSRSRWWTGAARSRRRRRPPSR